MKRIDRIAEELIRNDGAKDEYCHRYTTIDRPVVCTYEICDDCPKTAPEPTERVLIETRTDILAGVNSHGISTVAQYDSWTVYGSLESAYLQVGNHLMADLVRARYSGKGA